MGVDVSKIASPAVRTAIQADDAVRNARQLYKYNPQAFSVGPAKPPKRIRQQTKPLMNRLETEFHERLKQGVGAGQDWHPQGMRLRLANGVTLTVDFFGTGIIPTCYEVKGPMAWDDAIVKLKVAASLWPCFKWVLVWKNGTGQWCEQVVLP